MDIVIKSYNRAYLLDRVLRSVYRHVLNGLGQVIILDDGTPEQMLGRIVEKYPDVIIKYSPNYRAKLAGKRFGAPVQFWREEIKNVSENFLLLEDDMWLVEDIDLDIVDSLMKEKHMPIFKLWWAGNTKMILGDFNAIDKDKGIIENTRLPLASELLVKNRFYLHSLMILLRLMPKDYFVEMYTFYGVASQVFKRDFYLYVWPPEQNTIEEMIQLGLASQYFRENKDYRPGRVIDEYVATSYTSSSTGSKEKLGFDMNQLNAILNEAWFNNQFDTLSNFPNDFTLTYLSSFLTKEMSSDEIDAWKEWSIGWRKHFTAMGSDLTRYNNPHEWNGNA